MGHFLRLTQRLVAIRAKVAKDPIETQVGHRFTGAQVATSGIPHHSEVEKCLVGGLVGGLAAEVEFGIESVYGILRRFTTCTVLGRAKAEPYRLRPSRSAQTRRCGSSSLIGIDISAPVGGSPAGACHDQQESDSGVDVTALSVEVEAAHVTASSTVERRYVAPTRAAERVLAHVLAEVVGVGHVSINGKFFEDLGADALIMAQICVRVRKRADLPLVSMKDIYQPPTLNSLTIAPEPMHPVNAAPDESPPFAWTTAPVSSLQYVRCGTQRCLTFSGIPT